MKINNDWDEIIGEEFNKDYYKAIREFLKNEYKTKIIYPDMYDIYAALKLTSYEQVKVVIIGQDPYHGENQAHGLCFSVKPGVAIPPSLLNIYKELRSDMGYEIPEHGYLEKWAKQGVLMLNSVLTVRANQAASHSTIGWQNFTDAIIKSLNNKKTPVVFILWGSHAINKKKLITNNNHLIIESVHPSPLSAYRGFFGSKPFSRTNQFLEENKITPVDWRVE